MEKTATETIDGIAYTSIKLPASIGLALLPRLVAMLGEQFVKIVSYGGFDKLTESPAVIAALVSGIAEKMTEGDIADLVPRLLRNIKADKLRTINGSGGGAVLDAFDDHFSGEYLHLFRVVAFAVRHNYAGFTLGAGSIGVPSNNAAPKSSGHKGSGRG